MIKKKQIFTKGKSLIKNILIASAFFSILLFVVFVIADEPAIGTRGIPAIKNLGKEWTITKQTGAESNFNVIFADVKNKSTDICFVLKDGINPSSVDLTDKLIYSQDGSLILDDKNKPIALKYETAKCLVNGTMRNGYHILLTDAQAVNINGYIQLGSNTIVLVYQEQKLINYQTDFGEINVSLSCENVNQNDIWIFDRTENYKFGANGTFEGLKNCTYSIVSSTKLSRNGNSVYVTSSYTINGNEHEKHIIDFNDICNKNYEPYLVWYNESYLNELEPYEAWGNITLMNETTGEEYNESYSYTAYREYFIEYSYTAYNYSSNCQFNSINKYVTEVRFLTNNSIDPEFDNIIEIVSAEHLLNNYTFVSDIYEEVKARDNIWSEVIPVNDYVRVVFNRSINSGKQISIYVRSNGTASVEFYEEGESNLITKVDDIHEDKMYHVYLTDLIGEQDTFDLKVLGDDVEFDYILDDDTIAPNISFVGETPASGSSQSGTSIIVNVSSADDNGEHFVATNFDNSLVSWWRMDDANSTTVFDYMGRNNGSKVGGVVINSSSGRFGNGSWFVGEEESYIKVNSIPTYLTKSFWQKVNTVWKHIVETGNSTYINGVLGCPGNMSFIDKFGGYCVDQFEASMLSANSTAMGNATDVANRDNVGTMKAMSVGGVVPWVEVDQVSARTACSNAGKNLCTDAQWLGAANVGGRVYNLPSDLAVAPYYCVTGSTTYCLDESYNLGDACDTGRNKTGGISKCVSAEGVYDMVGNVWEWTNNTATAINPLGNSTAGTGTADEYYINTTNLQWSNSSTADNGKYGKDYVYFLVTTTGRAVRRGGRWSTGADAGPFAAVLDGVPATTSPHVGFRCCSAPLLITESFNPPNSSGNFSTFDDVFINGSVTYNSEGAYLNGTLFMIGNVNATVDEVLVFNRSLSASEILALYNASASKYYNNFTGLVEGAHTFKSYAVDLAGNLNSTETRSVTITAGGDTCTYGGSGIWALDCSNNCVFTTTQTIANQDNVTITGSGVLNFSNNGKWSFSGSSQYVTVGSGCTLNINPGGGWSY